MHELTTAPRLEPSPPAAGELNGLASVICEQLERRPVWAKGDWLDRDEVLELATLRHVTLDLVRWAIGYAREETAAGRTRSSASLVRELVRQPTLERVRRREPEPAADDDERPMKIREAAAFLGCSVRKLEGLVAKRKVPHYRIGRALCFRRTSLRAWLETIEVTDHRTRR